MNNQRAPCAVSIDMTRTSCRTLAIFGLLGLAIAACGASNSSAAKGPHSRSTNLSVGSTAGRAPLQPTAKPSSSMTAQSSPAASSALGLPGVVADCTSALPYSLIVRPASITLACADNGWGVEAMVWTSWTASSATGTGTFWEKLCKPNCAEGNIGTYPVAVTLSAVQTSARSSWFSRLEVAWEGIQPPDPTPDRFALMPPGT